MGGGFSQLKVKDSDLNRVQANISLAFSRLTTPSTFPVGAVIAFAGDTAPSGYLLCDGSAVSRTKYKLLFGVLGVSCGNGDGSGTFNLPDYRGMFLRGVTGTATTDPNASSRTAMNTGGNTGNNVGSVQTSGFGSHTHTGTTDATDLSHTHTVPFYTTVTETSGGANSVQTATTSGTVTSSGASASMNHTHTITTAGTGGSETRPINAYINWVIKT